MIGLLDAEIKSRINRFALQFQNAEHAFMDLAVRFSSDESFQPLDSQGEFP